MAGSSPQGTFPTVPVPSCCRTLCNLFSNEVFYLYLPCVKLQLESHVPFFIKLQISHFFLLCFLFFSTEKSDQVQREVSMPRYGCFSVKLYPKKQCRQHLMLASFKSEYTVGCSQMPWEDATWMTSRTSPNGVFIPLGPHIWPPFYTFQSTVWSSEWLEWLIQLCLHPFEGSLIYRPIIF